MDEVARLTAWRPWRLPRPDRPVLADFALTFFLPLAVASLPPLEPAFPPFLPFRPWFFEEGRDCRREDDEDDADVPAGEDDGVLGDGDMEEKHVVVADDGDGDDEDDETMVCLFCFSGGLFGFAFCRLRFGSF